MGAADSADTAKMWLWIAVSGLVLSATNGSFYTALNLTGPVFINYGAFFTVPLAFCVDVAVRHYTVTLWPVLGALCIMSGFAMLEIIEEPMWFTRRIDRIKALFGKLRRRDEETENMKFMQQIDGKIDMIEMDENG